MASNSRSRQSKQKTVASSVITLTFGDVAENHVRMQKIGEMSDKGFSCDLLRRLAELHGGELHDLRELLPEEDREKAPDTLVLVLRNWLEEEAGELLTEQLGLTPDTKCLSRGRVVNKIARYNLCFSEVAQQAEYEVGKGTIVSYSSVPHLNSLREKVTGLVSDGEDITLNCEGNYYYDTKKCYIGWHGDAERRRVVGVRLGPYKTEDGVTTIQDESYPLRFRWHHRTEVVGETLEIGLKHGDLYIMSEHAVGTLWMSRSLYVPRHSAGSVKEPKAE